MLTNGRFDVPGETSGRLAAAGIRIDERRIVRLVASGDYLEGIELADGGTLARDVLFARPAQRQVELVRSLGLALDDKGLVHVDDSRETSIRGIYAAGDLVNPAQGAVLAAASGTNAAAQLNHALTAELATAGALA